MKPIPVIDLSRCTDCDSCLSLCPNIFRRNDQTGLIEVVDLDEYAEDDVQEAMSNCPAGCISWDSL